MKNLFDNAVQQSVISSSAMEKETSLLVHSAMNHIIIGNPMCCGAYAQNAISAIKISHHLHTERRLSYPKHHYPQDQAPRTLRQTSQGVSGNAPSDTVQ